MGNYLLIDIGGTMIKYGVADQEGNFTFDAKLPTHSELGGLLVMERIGQVILECKERYALNGIAVSATGQIDPATGEVVYSGPTMKDYQGINIIEELKKFAPELSITIENDVNCALLSELKTVKEGYAMMVTIGTGIGAALSIDDAIIRGSRFSAGEIAYMKIKGKEFQEIASTSALVREVQEYCHDQKIDGYQVFELAKKNAGIRQIIENFYDNLALGLSYALLTFPCDYLFIGGGIAERKEFPKIIYQRLARFIPCKEWQQLTVLPASNGNKAGMLGALAWHLQLVG